MRASSRKRVYVAHAAVALVLLAVAPVITIAARADGGPAHDLAERFAAEAEKTERRAAERAAQQRQRQSEDELRRHESEMLARARAEALARESAEREETNRRRAAELERLETERRAEEQRRQEAAQRAAEERRLADLKAEEERRAAAADAARREAQARERQAEADRISEALRQARDARERRREAEEREANRLLEEAERQAALPPPPPQQPSPPPVEEAGSMRFAVLLVMQPGDRGIRRTNKTADPVLCSDHGCYVSTGAATPATLLQQRKALGFGRTWGGRAGACANALGCIFRGVEVASTSFLQPVDMRVMRHDRREAKTIAHGSRCGVVAGRLTCREPYRGPDYVMWLVPERLASEVGPGLLERAVAEGLTEPEHARVEHPIRR